MSADKGSYGQVSAPGVGLAYPSPELALRAIRIDLGLSQDQLANQLGLYQPAISRWETGRGGLPFPRLVEFSAWLGYRVGIYVEPDPRFNVGSFYRQSREAAQS